MQPQTQPRSPRQLGGVRSSAVGQNWLVVKITRAPPATALEKPPPASGGLSHAPGPQRLQQYVSRTVDVAIDPQSAGCAHIRAPSSHCLTVATPGAPLSSVALVWMNHMASHQLGFGYQPLAELVVSEGEHRRGGAAIDYSMWSGGWGCTRCGCGTRRTSSGGGDGWPGCSTGRPVAATGWPPTS